ncbi:hypothetical protein RP20_CCG002187 [Aedes albopictus]|nr:hypothetical protein RP20_CCG002187 [Aedes albopictus]
MSQNRPPTLSSTYRKQNIRTGSTSAIAAPVPDRSNRESCCCHSNGHCHLSSSTWLSADLARCSRLLIITVATSIRPVMMLTKKIMMTMLMQPLDMGVCK